MESSRQSSMDSVMPDASLAMDKDLFSSFNSTSSSESHLGLPLKGLNDPFSDESLPSHGAGRHRDTKPPTDLLGQFSFAPATQTTVVTTTTTTTTSFPPLMMKAPHHLYELDPKLYPLAASPTPHSIKRFCLDVGGRPTVFHEADDASDTLQKLHQQQKDLQSSQGVLRSVTRFPITKWVTPKGRLSRAITPADTGRIPTSMCRGGPNWQPTPPVSISEAARLASTQSDRKGSDGRAALSNGSTRNTELARQNTSSRLQICQTSTPITPSLGAQTNNEEEKSGSHHNRRPEHSSTRQTTTTPEFDPQEHQQTLSPRPEENLDDSFDTVDSFMGSDVPQTGGFARPSTRYSPSALGIVNAQGSSNASNGIEMAAGSARPRPTVLNTTAAQDISLPSPSLSPVTAAANLQTRMGYFEDVTISMGSRLPALSSPPHESPEEDDALSNGTHSPKRWEAFGQNDSGTDVSAKPSSTLSLMDIPKILDSFEAMPVEMKSYVMYQLLRRCPKPVLHFVADVVNTALKCDFLNLLPLELCQNVIGHLDVKSLCRAAQVSKKWRQVIDSDEKTWKRLLDTDGYVLPDGELQRAIWEGWGWQHGSGPDNWEKNIGDLEQIRSGKWSIPIANLGKSYNGTSEDVPVPAVHSKRTKRKAAPKSKSASRKQQKKKGISSDVVARFDCEALMKHVSMADGPYAAAQAAAIAVPTSQIGVPSLRNLHLYKSMYRRHHQISSNWMQDEIKPRHLAFKAHQRHVVTCLQFDTDKILTGSDDTNINVYDTQTGALRATLEGHEGGVWALQYQGNTLVSGSTDRSVRVWDIEKGVCTHVFQGHTSTVRCLVILMPTEVGKTLDGNPIMMPKEPLIITGSRDSNLRVWRLPKPEDPLNVQTGQLQDDTECSYFVRALTGHIHSVRAIAAHGDTLVSGSYDCNVRVWKISTGETIHRLQGHSQKVYSVVLDHERNRCISGSMDNLVKVWSLETGNVLFNLEGHSSLVGLLDLQRNRLVSAAADSTLRIWDPENGHCKSKLSAHTGAITCFQHDGHKVISGSDRTLKMWDVRTGKFARDLLTGLSGVWQVKFDERRCVAAVQRNQLTYIEVLDFGASRDGVPAAKRGKRTLVNFEGVEVNDPRDTAVDLDVDVADS